MLDRVIIFVVNLCRDRGNLEVILINRWSCSTAHANYLRDLCFGRVFDNLEDAEVYVHKTLNSEISALENQLRFLTKLNNLIPIKEVDFDG